MDRRSFAQAALASFVGGGVAAVVSEVLNIPSRISTDDGDPGETPASPFWSVFLDGYYVDRCITADAGLGYVVVAKADSSGKILVDLDRNEIVRETRYGQVLILWKGRHG